MTLLGLKAPYRSLVTCTLIVLLAPSTVGCGSSAPSCSGSDVDAVTRERLARVTRMYDEMPEAWRRKQEQMIDAIRAVGAARGVKVPEAASELSFFSTRTESIDEAARSCDCVGSVDLLSHPSAAFIVGLMGIQPSPDLIVDGRVLLQVPFRAQYDSEGQLYLQTGLDEAMRKWAEGR